MHPPASVDIGTPAEVGLPEKFFEWRSHQVEAIDVMITSPQRTVGLCAPCGSGKSVSYIAAALLSGQTTCIVTPSKGLQSQSTKDFGSIGLVDVRGKASYKCDMHPEDPTYTCEEGHAARCPYMGTVGCPCSQAEMRALSSRLIVTNYAKWTSTGVGMYSPFRHVTQVIFDEATNCFDALSDAMQVVLHHREVEQDLAIDFPAHPEVESLPIWRAWASCARAIAEQEMRKAQARIAGVSDPRPSWVRHYTHMRNLMKRLSLIATAQVNDWVLEQIEDGYKFDPIRPGKYVESALFFRLPKIIMVSATLRPKSMYMLGIKPEHSHFQEFPSDFNPQRCPIYYVPTMRVDSRSADSLPLLWAKVDQILAPRSDRKGIIQTTSYGYQQAVRSASRFGSRMILNDRGMSISSTINSYMQAGPGAVLVSPSVGEGYDFADDLCRYQIILKIPFEPPSKILKARELEDRDYRNYRAMQRLEQSVGRDVRSKTDWSERFILDSHCEWFLPRNIHYASRSFGAFLKGAAVLPQPLRIGDM